MPEALHKFKVKRNVYEFMELFNYLENKNPSDRYLQDFDYNKMFGPSNQLEDHEKVNLLENFLNSLTRLNADI